MLGARNSASGLIPRRGLVTLALAAILTLAAVSPYSISAQTPAPDPTTMSMEELMNVEVYSASKHRQSIGEAPSSVTVITAEDIQRYGYRTLADALKSVRGFYVNNDRNYSYVGIRGFAPPGDYNSRVLLLVDGQRMNDNIYHEALVGTEFPLDVDAIERIEIVRGPSSSLYGSDAFFGVINVITKSRSSVKNGTLTAEAGTYGSYKEHFTFGSTLPRNVNLFLAGSTYTSDGQSNIYFPEYNDPATNNGIAHNADGDSARNLLIKVSAGSFTLQSVLGTREKGIPTGSFGTVFDDPRTRTTDSEGNIVLSYTHRWENGTSASSSLSYSRYEYSGDYVYEAADAGLPSVVNRDKADGAWWNWVGQVRTRPLQNHEITLGGEFQENVRQDQKNFDLEPYFLYLNRPGNSKVAAGFIQDEFRIHRKLILNAGLRYDHYDTFGGSTNPRLGLLYRATEHTNLKFLYGQAFRAPSDYELYYAWAGTQEANPGLQPETIRTFEGILEQGVGAHLRLTASAYLYDFDAGIRQVTRSDGVLVFRNTGDVDAKGLELEAQTRWARNLQAGLNYSLQHSVGRENAPMADSPRHLAKANTQVPLFGEKLVLSAEGQYTSSRIAASGYRIGGFGTANATILAKDLFPNFTLSLSAYNLFDKRYGDPGAAEHRQISIPQDGRSLRLTVKYSF